ncbi:MAG TPA: imidazole glycerol phosphate synthase subunit HisH, partial [Rhizomicrobium sp.]|nr:imidazole glycerol phosphate synthase subunit HisH [Rhizomicrobium sp.]
MARAALIDYGSGNLASAAKALSRAAGGTGLEIVTTAEPEAVRGAERIVLPGVGAFADCMRGLSAVPGMVSVLREKV